MNRLNNSKSTMNLFYSYAHEDEAYRNELEKHLILLQRKGIITSWSDSKIVPGSNWAYDINEHLNNASIILLLVSSDFLASDHCYNTEMQRALEREKNGEALVIPIILRPVELRNTPFAHLQCLPSGGKPVTEWENRDTAFLNIARGISTAIERVHTSSLKKKNSFSASHQHRQRLLKQMQTIWIDRVLKNSSYISTRIKLEIHEQPEAIANPWRFVAQETNQRGDTIPPNMLITNIYDDADGELLILGEPGAGKTTLLLELADELLKRARIDEAHPIPVVFNLSSWKSGERKKYGTLEEWLVEELEKKYQIPYKIGRLWVDNNQVLPLLDGFDETDKENYENCIDKVNNYKRDHSLFPLVICSRLMEYETQKKRLFLQKAVVIQPLTVQQVGAYLASVGEESEALRFVLQRDMVLQELATTPLMLSVLTLVCREKSVEEISKILESTENLKGLPWGDTPLSVLRKHVLESYVQHMFQRRSVETRYTPQQTISWLTLLAKVMRRNYGTEISLKELEFFEYNLLEDWQKRFYQWCFAVIHIIIFLIGMFLLLKNSLFWLSPVHANVFLILEIMIIPLLLFTTFQLWDRESSMSARARRLRVRSVCFYCQISLPLLNFLFTKFSFIHTGFQIEILHPIVYILLCLFVAFAYILLNFLLSFIEKSDLLQHYKRSVIIALRIFQLTVIFATLFEELLFLISGLVFVGLLITFISLLIGVLYCWLSLLMEKYIGRIITHFLLWHAGMLPWKVSSFLDYAVERALLYRIGSDYAFIHQLFRDYFSGLTTS